MDRTVLIVAASGRALAASARRGGFVPLVADFYGDQDTIAVAHAHRRLKSGPGIGMAPDAVFAALESLSRTGEPAGIVCGSGFEDRPELVARIARRWTLFGNGADVIARVKDPLALAELCRACAIPHPATALDRPADANGWLVKRRGGAGGTHVKADVGADREGRYFQRRVAGTPVSALVLSNGRRATVLGFSEQWCSATPKQPFRYGGAVSPAAIAPQTADALTEAVLRLLAAVPLSGLNSIDFMVAGDEFWLLEVNPRPGATLDVFEPAGGSLFALHVDACRGALARGLPPRRHVKAAAIVYARQDIPFAPALDWPHWAADRPHAGVSMQAGEPLCTVTATAATPDRAKRLVARRSETVLSWMCARAA